MNDEERFEQVLEELASLIRDLGDLAFSLVLIGGQVLALESKAGGGDGRIRVTTATGINLDRGFSFESDLLFDVDAMGSHADRLTEILRARGYRRTREFKWRRDVDGGHGFEIDLFVPEGSDLSYVPTGMTTVTGAERAAVRHERLRIELRSGRTLELNIPDPVGFLATKIAAIVHRDEPKDAFDVFCCVHRHTPTALREQLRAAGHEGSILQERLRNLFGTPDARGVRDVLNYAASTDEAVSELLTRAVVDLFTGL